ncbi:InlB B-repeat-containing protein [Fervidobacterium sp.]
MVTVRFRIEITSGNDDALRFIGMAINTPLPSIFWDKGYSVGTGMVGDVVEVERNIPAGRHYVVVGTSTDPNYIVNGQPAYMRVWVTVAGAQPFASLTVHRNQYGYLIFDLSTVGTATIVAGGNVAPDQPPPNTGTGTNYTLTLVVGSNGAVDVTVDGSTTRYYTGTTSIVKPNNTAFRLTAVPNTGYIFDGWFDNGTRISSSTTLTFNLTSSITRRAIFKADTPPPPNSYNLTINVSSGGKLFVNNTPYTNTSTQLQFTSGAVVTLKVQPDNGYVLVKFNIDGNPVATLMQSSSVNVTMNTNHTVDVQFEPSTTTGDGGDWTNNIQEMMNKMMEIMMPMMGMMMVMQMMTSLIGSLAGGF